MTATPAAHALGWALVHFLWQGAALAVLLTVMLAVTPHAAARARYALSLVTLAAMLGLPIVTGLQLYRSSTNRAATHHVAPDQGEAIVVPELDPPSEKPSAPLVPSASSPTTRTESVSPMPDPSPIATATRVRGLLDPALPWVIAVWATGVVLLSIRLTHGWFAARRLRTQGTTPAPASLNQMLQRLADRLRVSRPVQLLESAIVQVPAVVGWLRPVVLVPASALTGLTPQQLEVLVAHELAHVRRYDYLVNIAQCVVETLLFYHPAVWWVSSRVREEREHCCDDLVVQLCGDARLYASALVGMERLRAPTPPLALAATGGSLLHRIRRLVLPPAPRTEQLPRWIAGVVGVATVTLALLLTGSDRVTAQPTQIITADTTRSAPDTVLKHPDPAQPLAQRWEWARTQARQLGRRTYWIGYRIARPAWLEHSVYVDRGAEIRGHDITISGRLFGDFQGFMFRGVRLAPLIRGDDSDDIALLFGFSDVGGRTTLTHIHVASFYLPVDFRGRTLVWLGDASDTHSLPLVEGLFAATPQAELREDIVAAVGIHGSSEAVVPILIRWLTGREPTDVRTQAAEWLGFHPASPAVVALSRAARSDQSGDVRREAAESLGENTLPAATDSTIAIARTAADADVRREAVEGLGEKDDAKTLTALVSIAQSDRNEDVQREAVETLGEMPSGRGLKAVRDIAGSHPRPDVRREAVETLGENLPAGEAIPVLTAIAASDPNSDVQREAVETLGETKDTDAVAALAEFARNHPNSEVRREAIETLGEMAPTAETVRLLSSIVANDRNEDVQREAVETLGEIGELGLPAVIDIARSHPHPDVRREAIETIGEQASPAQALDILAQIARRDNNADVQREAVETLGELHDDRAYHLIVDFARNHPVSDVRREAIETLVESRTGRADSVIAILSAIAQGSGDPDVAREAVETLGEMHDGRALAQVARVARSRANVDVRREAIETYGENASADSALALLTAILETEAPEDIYNEVLETLEELEGGAGIPALIDIARSHPNRELRAEALRRLAESDDPRAQKLFERTLRRP